jgi:hypothetical protein
MKHGLKILNIAAVLSIVLFYGVEFLFCGAGQDCTDAGIVIAPLIIPTLVLVPAAIIGDLIVFVRHLLRPRYKHFASGIVLVILGIIVMLFVVRVHSRNEYKHHFPVNKAVELIDNCQVYHVSDDSEDGYISMSTTSSAGDEWGIRVATSGRPQLLAAMNRSAAKCHYDTSLNRQDSLYFTGSN